MKKLLYLLILPLFIISCEPDPPRRTTSSGTNNSGGGSSVPDENLSVDFQYILSTGELGGDVFSFSDAYWDDNGIYFGESNANINWVWIKDVAIGGTGQIGLLQSPYAQLQRDENGTNRTYSTKVRPNFWINSPNSNTLLEGGDGFTPSYYAKGSGYVTQGGYLKVTDFNGRYIAGECYAVGWVYHNQLNREVMLGLYIEFSGVEYLP